MNRCARWIIFAAATLIACRSASPPVTPLPRVIEEWSGEHGETRVAGTHVIRTPEEWRSVWQLAGRREPQPLDPAKEIAVAVFLGERRTGGYAVGIIETALQAKTLIINYREKTPAPGRMVAQIITSPWAIAVLPASELSVTFRELPSKPAARP